MNLVGSSPRVGDAKGRVRRIAIVALARKLMVALWRYLETGVVPDGRRASSELLTGEPLTRRRPG